MARSIEGSALARGILALAQTLGLETVAEGIETAEQLAALRELGCQLGQGYLFASPLAPQPSTSCSNATTPGCTPQLHRPTTNALSAASLGRP